VSRVEEIETAIESLAQDEYRHIVQWFRLREEKAMGPAMDAHSATANWISFLTKLSSK